MADKKGFTLDDILAEQRAQRESTEPEGAEEVTEEAAAEPAEPQKVKKHGVSDDTADLNAFATGNIPALKDAAEYVQETLLADEPKEKEKPKKKKRRGLFGRKKVPDFDESDDMYYGLQLKPIDEYRKGYDPATGEFTLAGAKGYEALFDDSKKAIDDEVEQNFLRLQKERRRRVAEAVQTAGVDESDIADEFGIVAPMPVTAFAADPYARQNGIEVEGIGEMSDIQKAMLETSSDKSMEIKLNVFNDTVELQRVKDVPAVSEESVNKILESIETENGRVDVTPDEEYQSTKPTPVEVVSEAPAEAEKVPEAEEQEAPETESAGTEAVETETAEAETPVSEEKKDDSIPKSGDAVVTGRPLGEIPQVAAIYEYRSRSIPTHVIDADVLQSALLSESEDIKQGDDLQQASRNRVHGKKQETEEYEEEIDVGESIDDYTGPADAKSISHELKSDMRELTMRMMITGVCTALLTLVNIIFGARFSGSGDAGSSSVVFVVLSVVFLFVSVGVCYRTVANGLRALIEFNANSDSAVAVAAVTVLAQTIGSIFFRDDIAGGKLHIYAVILSALLFVNAAGKLVMIRRIHSNFRFVSSREQKYSVRVFDDYNTALKMARDKVVEKPAIAYQCKAGFLKRFLELSYDPDPSESASRMLAPIGLIASLVVCIVCLLMTHSVSTAVSALAAASCACVAAGNMLSVNLPVSRLCRVARRAGAMVVGYDAVEKLGNVNAVLVDADEVFPRGTVVLNGIKTFGNKAGAETAIMAASALMKEVGGPLCGVFDQVISENEDNLPEVESYSYEAGSGIVGRVDGQKIYIGTRSLMINHRIDPPAREEETQYSSGNKVVVYIAVDSVIAAMLVLTYSADHRRKNEFRRLEDSGISVLVRTTDPNVTAQLMARLFNVDMATVGILDGDIGDTAGELLGEEINRADAVVATKGRVESMMSVVSACVEEKRTANLVVAIQNAAVILGFVFVAFMACFGGMRQLSSLVLFLFEAFWLLVIIVLPKLRR